MFLITGATLGMRARSEQTIWFALLDSFTAPTSMHFQIALKQAEKRINLPIGGAGSNYRD